MPTPAAEAAIARRGASVALRLFQTRRVLRQERRDLEALLAEVLHNLAAARVWWHGDTFNRRAHYVTRFETTVWRQLAYPLTALTGSRLIDETLAAELNALAAELERAQRETCFDPQWEPRLVAVADALRRTLLDHPRHVWQRPFLRRPDPATLPSIDDGVTIPQTIDRLQRFGPDEEAG